VRRPLPTFFFVEVTRPPGMGLELIKAAREEGFDVVVLVSKPEANTFLAQLGVTFIQASTQTAEGVVEAINRTTDTRAAVGITTAHEFYAPVAAAAARLLGLPGPNPEAIAECRRKDLQRLRLSAAGVRIPKFFVCETVDEAKAAIAAIGGPLVVKTVALTEGFGVRWCDTVDEAERHADRILSGEFNATRLPVPGGLPHICMVESPLRGRQYTVEVFDGKAIAVTATGLGPRPGFIEISHVVPCDLDPGIEAVAHRVAEQAVAAMDVAWGPIHVEIRIETDGPAVIEVNPRLAGGGIPYVLRDSVGLDLCRATICRCSGRPVDLSTSGPARVAELRLMVLDGEGEVTATGNIAAAQAVKGIVALDIPLAVGTNLKKQGRNSDSVGWALASGASRGECAAAIDEAFALATPHVRNKRAALIPPGAL
jgi:S-sulfo-L-cysteine synthase (3-phospho-L-serine-dependent)